MLNINKFNPNASCQKNELKTRVRNNNNINILFLYVTNFLLNDKIYKNQ
jgi:hypothetical protein